jgi:hypothetical protein
VCECYWEGATDINTAELALKASKRQAELQAVAKYLIGESKKLGQEVMANPGMLLNTTDQKMLQVREEINKRLEGVTENAALPGWY